MRRSETTFSVYNVTIKLHRKIVFVSVGLAFHMTRAITGRILPSKRKIEYFLKTRGNSNMVVWTTFEAHDKLRRMVYRASWTSFEITTYVEFYIFSLRMKLCVFENFTANDNAEFHHISIMHGPLVDLHCVKKTKSRRHWCERENQLYDDFHLRNCALHKVHGCGTRTKDQPHIGTQWHHKVHSLSCGLRHRGPKSVV